MNISFLSTIKVVYNKDYPSQSRSDVNNSQRRVINDFITDYETAQAKAHHRILLPSWLPNTTLKLDNVRLAIETTSEKEIIYDSLLHYIDEASNKWIVIKQHLNKGDIIVKEPITEETIGQIPAIFVTRMIGKNNSIAILVGFWEFGDFLMEIQGLGLTIEEAKAIGASLA